MHVTAEAVILIRVLSQRQILANQFLLVVVDQNRTMAATLRPVAVTNVVVVVLEDTAAPNVPAMLNAFAVAVLVILPLFAAKGHLKRELLNV